jgi:hypothetical protein
LPASNFQSFFTTLFLFSLVFKTQELMEKKIVELQLSSWRWQVREKERNVQGKEEEGKSFVQPAHK